MGIIDGVIKFIEAIRFFLAMAFVGGIIWLIMAISQGNTVVAGIWLLIFIPVVLGLVLYFYYTRKDPERQPRQI